MTKLIITLLLAIFIITMTVIVVNDFSEAAIEGNEKTSYELRRFDYITN